MERISPQQQGHSQEPETDKLEFIAEILLVRQAL